MAFWQNVKNLFKEKEEKESRISSIRASSNSGGAVWSENNYENFAKETYLKNVIAFRSIDIIAKNVSLPEWHHYKKNSDGTREQINESWVTELIKRPNPNEGWPFLMLSATAYLAMSGNSFFEKVKPETGPNKDEIKELYTHRPDRFSFKLNKDLGIISKYIYEVNGKTVEWEVDPITQQADVLQIKNFNPVDDWWGASATESTAREIDTSNSATEWNKNLIDNQGRPGMVFTLVGQMGEEGADELEKYLQAQKTGAANAGKNLILTGESGTKAEPYGFSLNDLDFLEGGRETARRIALGYGVPPQLLGIPGDSTYNNVREARAALWEDTVLFYLSFIKTELNNWIFGKDSDEFIDFNLDNIPALAYKRDKL